MKREVTRVTTVSEDVQIYIGCCYNLSMEISHTVQLAAPELLTFTATHVAIAAHRSYRFTNRRELTKRYHYVSLLAEHVISHATIPLLMTPIDYLMNTDPYSNYGILMGALCSATKGFLQDWNGPEGKPQWDQLIADATGIGLYAMGMIAVSHIK